MRELLIKYKNFLGPYNYRPGFIYLTILIFSMANLRTYTFDYPYGPERIKFFLIGFFTYVLLGLPLYVALKISWIFWKDRNKPYFVYLLELAIGSLITLIAQLVGKKYLVPLFDTEEFLKNGVFLGEVITRFVFAVIFVAITHNRLRTLGLELENASALNTELNKRYAKLIESDEEIRSNAARLLHDRIQAKLMLAGAKLTRITQVLSEEGKLGVLPVIKELEGIRSIDVREVSQLLSPNLAGEGLVGSCENLCKEFEASVEFTIDISRAVEDLDEEFILGVYRIIEQGVINSIKHGPATKIFIEVFVSSSNKLIVEVRDNGPGGNGKSSGTGTVIIDAWVSILGGEKEIKSEAGNGFTLRVTAPVKLGT